ncbi:hypothetical protein ACGFIF_15690 [Kribbella sp. NPDC049174]|uniref:hypothetical protein n=1 Tax=Kribbella sp. NPDC049174 TaxID=3364112 RepID=UPI00371E24B8
MNRRWSALALSAVAMGALAVTATEASADPKDPRPGVSAELNAWPDEGSGYPGAATGTGSTTWPDEGSGYPGAATGSGSTTWPDEGAGYPGAATQDVRRNYDSRYGVTPVQPVQAASAASTSDNDDATAAVLQAGASALGGAGVAFGAMWVFRRHQRLAS